MPQNLDLPDPDDLETYEAAVQAVADVILERWPQRVITDRPAQYIVTIFNDHGNTRKEDVIWALEEAARRSA